MVKQIDCLGLGIMPLDLLFSVPEYPEAGSKIDGRGLLIQGGGPIPNVLIGLARMGHTGALITAVADDLIARIGLEEVQAEGIETDFLVHKRGTSLAAAGLIEEGSGRRTMILNRELFIEPDEIDTSELPIPKIIHMDGRDLGACIKLAEWGRRIGAINCFDIGSIRNDVSPIFPLIDHLVVADAYAFGYTGADSGREAIDKLRELCPGTVVVTEGIDGATGWEDGEYVFQPAYRVKNVDTTGAGDAFHTGYIYGLLHNFSLAQRLEFGAATAALKCTRMGARTGIPSLSQVKQFIASEPETYA